LAAGEIGFESDTGKIKIGNGSTAWNALAYTASSTAVTYLFNATAAQTTFSGTDTNGLTLAYTVGAEQVYLNGALQVRGSDYTATNGTSIVLTSGALVNDVLNVIAYSAMSVADTYTQAQANALFIPDAIVDAKGDLIAATASDTVARLAVGSNGEIIVADSSTATGLRYQGSISAGRNFVINGSMDIWQRGATGLGTSTGSYTADRWVLGSSSTTVTRDTDVPTSPYFQYSLKMVGTSDNSIIQRVEASNSILLAGQTITFSFYAKRTSGTGALDVRFYYPSATDNFASTTQIGSTVVVSASPSSSWTRYSVTAAIGTNITTGLQILINNTGAATTFITGAQLELGSVATNFSRAGGTIQGELAACQRYFYRHASGISQAIMTAGAYSSTIVGGTVFFKSPMRTAPSLTVPNVSSYFAFYANGTFVTASTLVLQEATPNSGTVYGTFGTSTVGHAGWITCINAGAYVDFGAEL
jgi:hypothetical protein